MNPQYIIRLDDACPTMNKVKWDKLTTLLNKFTIKPIVAVIPNNQDTDLLYDEPDPHFWEKVKSWNSNGWEIAMHGFTHQFITKDAGLVPLNTYSEFAGVSPVIQQEKIRGGIAIFKSYGLSPRVFVAPAHSLDLHTLEILKKESDINIISDGIALAPYQKHGFNWLPQQAWRCRKFPMGTWTFCLHPNTMTEADFSHLEDFVEKNHERFISIDRVRDYRPRMNIFDRFFVFSFWNLLKLKRLLR